MSQKSKPRKTKRRYTKPRNYKPTLSGDANDPTELYGLKVPRSLHNYLLILGPDKVKEIILDYKSKQT